MDLCPSVATFRSITADGISRRSNSGNSWHFVSTWGLQSLVTTCSLSLCLNSVCSLSSLLCETVITSLGLPQGLEASLTIEKAAHFCFLNFRFGCLASFPSPLLPFSAWSFCGWKWAQAAPWGGLWSRLLHPTHCPELLLWGEKGALSDLFSAWGLRPSILIPHLALASQGDF